MVREKSLLPSWSQNFKSSLDNQNGTCFIFLNHPNHHVTSNMGKLETT